MQYVKNDAQWAMITLGMMIRVEGIEPVMENRTKIPVNLISCTERLCGVKMTPERIAQAVSYATKLADDDPVGDKMREEADAYSKAYNAQRQTDLQWADAIRNGTV